MTQVPASSHGGGLPLTGGTLTGPLVLATTTGAQVPITIQLPTGKAASGSAVIEVKRENAGDVASLDPYGTLTLAADTVDPTNGGGALILNNHLGVGKMQGQADDGAGNAFPLKTAPAAPATVALVSGTGAQLSVNVDVESVTPVTFNPGAATTATCTVAVSLDNVTYYTLGVETEPAGVAFDGTIHLIRVRLPAAWYLKLTVNAQAVLGTTTYY